MSCNGCGQNPGTPLRCGQCKTTLYCSAECQRSDWPYHKRLCKPLSVGAPAPAAPTSSAAASTAVEALSSEDAPPAAPAVTTPAGPAKTGSSDSAPSAKEEEKLEWYRHREWRPEAKQEFKPTKLEGTTQSETLNRATSKSAWNAADTWEEKNMTNWANQWLESNLASEDETLGKIKVSKVSGDASACFVRGKIRYLFDLEVSLKIGNHEVKVADFCDHEETPDVKTPREFGEEKTRLLKVWIAKKRLLFVSAYQQTVI